MSTNSSVEIIVKDFVLGESVDITVINAFYEKLKPLLTDNSAVCVDAKNVKLIDTSALQLLCCWFQEAKKRNIKVTWKNIDGAFYQAAQLLGVSQHLALE